MVRNNGRSLVTTYATYGTLSLRVDYQPPSQRRLAEERPIKAFVRIGPTGPDALPVMRGKTADHAAATADPCADGNFRFASLDACKRVIYLRLDISGYSYFILIVSYLLHRVSTIITTSKPTTEQPT